MTLNKYIDLYNKKSGEKFVPHPGFKLFYLPERGFCQIHIEKAMVIVRQVCGDGRFWYDFSELMANMCGCKAVGTFYGRRNVLAYIRLWGYQIEYTEEIISGLKRYHCIKNDGTWALVSPYSKREDGTIIYMATKEVRTI